MSEKPRDGRDHEHQWIFVRKACCFVVECIIAGCRKQQTAYYLKGAYPKKGDPVILERETITRIGTSMDNLLDMGAGT